MKPSALANNACPYDHGAMQFKDATGVPAGKSDTQVLNEMLDWMKTRLPCVAGRREFNRGRYFIRVANRRNVKQIFEEYKTELAKGRAVACLFVFNDPRFYDGAGNTSGAFHFLASEVAQLGNRSAHDLANGEALTNSISLRCPVTNQVTTFDDFECIAFCPQSSDKTDPLYDPLMATPYPCVNVSSDVYAFSRFVADSTMTALGKPAHEEKDMNKLERVLTKCVERWQRVATTTIQNYEAMTDTSLCPVHVTAEGTHWIAAHKDPAFAEQHKEVHAHELPVLYGHRIVERWMKYFNGKEAYCASGMARDGVRA